MSIFVVDCLLKSPILLTFYGSGSGNLDGQNVIRIGRLRNLPAGAVKVARVAKGAERANDVKKGSRAKKCVPDQKAVGPHSTYRKDRNGKTSHWAEWNPNSKNPNGFEVGKRFDGIGPSHYNKKTDMNFKTPHVHDPKVPGGLRSPFPEEIP